ARSVVRRDDRRSGERGRIPDDEHGRGAVQGREGVRHVTVVALDIGGTHVTAAQVESHTGKAEPLVRVEYEPHADRAILLDGILGAALSVAGCATRAVGVAAPGPFDYASGICRVQGLGKLEAIYGVDLRSEL